MTRHTYACHVRFSDVDVYGHVNNVKYFEYFQEARLSFLQPLWQGHSGDGFTVVLARMDVSYRKPILFRSEPYTVESWVTRVGGSSFDIESEIKDGDTMLAGAHAVLVTFDLKTQRARPLADEERALLLSVIEG